jgi:hypothetical protein
MVNNRGFLDSLTLRRQPQCGIYLFLPLLTSIIYRFVDRLPPETASIARLTARYKRF